MRFASEKAFALLKGMLAIVLAFLILCPLLSIFARTLFPHGSLEPGYLLSVLLEEGNVRMITNSVLLGALVVLFSTVVALPLSYLFSRTELRQRKFFDVVFLIPFMTPPYISSMGWILFMQKRGLLQQLIPAFAGSEAIFFSLFGLVVVMGMHVYPFMLTIMKNAFLSVPSSLIEASQVSGSSFPMRIKRILLPLVSGNYVIGALLVFVKTVSEYGTPSTLGRRIGFDVFTTEIHRHSTVAPIDFAHSAALSVSLVSICLLLWFVQNLITSKRSYGLVGTRGNRGNGKRMGAVAKTLAYAYIAIVLLVSVGIPYFSVISTSLIKLRGYGLRRGNFTFQHYIELFTENDKGLNALLNSFVFSFLAAVICSCLALAVVLATRSTKGRRGKAFEAVGLLPEMVPSIVLVIGIMLFWNGIYKILPLYNTKAIMVLSYVILFLPYSVEYITSSFSQIGPSLISAGRVFGASRSYALRRITIPLLKKGIVTGWMMTFIIAFRELVSASLISPPNVLVVSTFIVREFEQGSVSVGMAMAVICVLFTTTVLLILNYGTSRGEK